MAQKPIIEKTNEFIDDTLEHASEGLGTLPGKARKQLGDLNRTIAPTVRHAAASAGAVWQSTRKQARENPGVTLCIAAFLGFALGFLMRGRD